MNIDRLYEIIRDCAVQCRTGPAVIVDGEEATEEQRQQINEGKMPGVVTEIFSMPHVSEVQKERSDMQIVDMVFIDIAVDQIKAEKHREEIVRILNDYPDMERFKSGPSYMELGREFGDQGFAMMVMAVGKVLGLWEIVSGKTMGASAQDARDMAGVGFLMISGYDPQGRPKATV